MNKLIYLANPYTGTKEEMEGRFESACEYAARLMRDGHYVFSPIAHSHPPAQYGLPKDYAYWKGYCELMIPKCDKMIVLMLKGWSDSVGVTAEIELAQSLNMPIEYISPYSFT